MALVNELVRVLGINLLASLAARLPARVGTSIQLMLVVAGSLLPLWPLYRGWVQLQDLLAYAALWMTLSVISTLIRLNTMTRRSPKTRFFALHYTIMIGALSLVSGAWAVILLLEAGPSGGWISLIPTACALLLAKCLVARRRLVRARRQPGGQALAGAAAGLPQIRAGAWRNDLGRGADSG